MFFFIFSVLSVTKQNLKSSRKTKNYNLNKKKSNIYVKIKYYVCSLKKNE